MATTSQCPRGTGIATYGLDLARTLQSGGHTVIGAFGLDVGRDPGLRETLFFDRVGQVETGRTVFGGRWHRRKELLQASIHRTLSPLALDVPLTDRVDKEAFADRLPHSPGCPALLACFPSHRGITATGRFLPCVWRTPHKSCPGPIWCRYGSLTLP
jgi:hypothetical protein